MPPYAIERVEEAETVPLIAWRGPVSVPTVSAGVKSAPVVLMVVVPVPPIARVFAERSVDDAPPKKRVSVEVEFPAPWNG